MKLKTLNLETGKLETESYPITVVCSGLIL
jgi:hypothetical protein